MKRSVWIPAAIAPVVIAGAVAAPALASTGSTTSTAGSPTAAQVLASVARSSSSAFSGRVHQSTDLGLPSLPSGVATPAGSASAGAASVLGLLTAAHDARVYVDGPSKARVQILGQLAEQDVIVNGASVWTWDSKTQDATHYTLPTKRNGATPAAPSTETPTTIAQRAISAITPTTDVSAPTRSTVAGRAAWQITLRPKSSSTLVADVVLSIDQKTGVPLAARIDAKGQKAAAFSVAYTSIDFSTPAANLFSFTPPSGAHVSTHAVPAHPHGTTKKHPDSMTPGTIQGSTAPTPSTQTPKHAGTGPKPTVTGTGWNTIVQLPADAAKGLSNTGKGGSARLLDELTTPVSDGRAVQTSLVTVLITTDGRVFAGAVPLSALQAAAG
ncbi:LolA family protein [Curtobacterium ammoniigenes]|uniref:LolA family protein n=1 Tax=Curtobacterium ammoniigenes TaxID=395387 RepID=UPI0008366271|nr:outer membrane lipoprotein carrier protein LolA [Curtobacterium ammoniigenes]